MILPLRCDKPSNVLFFLCAPQSHAISEAKRTGKSRECSLDRNTVAATPLLRVDISTESIESGRLVGLGTFKKERSREVTIPDQML